MKTSRRAFVTVAGASVATTLAGCGGGGGGSSPTAPSAGTPTPAPTPTPGSNEVRIPLMGIGETSATSVNLVGGLQTPLAVTRLSATEVVAVSRICTHESCTVALPASAGATLDCPCHGSRFRTTGQVVNGPAARPLSTFPAAIRGNEVVITIG